MTPITRASNGISGCPECQAGNSPANRLAAGNCAICGKNLLRQSFIRDELGGVAWAMGKSGKGMTLRAEASLPLAARKVA
jgi:hypothetical protein